MEGSQTNNVIIRWYNISTSEYLFWTSEIGPYKEITMLRLCTIYTDNCWSSQPYTTHTTL